MPTKKETIHRGEILAQAAAKTDLSVIQIARRAGYKTRGSFYNHIKNPNLSFTILEKYGKILNHDFSEDIPAMPKLVLEEPPAPDYKTVPKTMDEALQLISKLKDSNYDLLVKYNASLEREIELKSYINKIEEGK